MVTAPTLETETKVEVAPAFIIRKRSAVCPTRARKARGTAVVDVASTVKTPDCESEETDEVPTMTWSPVAVSSTYVPESVHPEGIAPAQTLLFAVHTLWPCSYIDPLVTTNPPANVEVADAPLTFNNVPMEVEEITLRVPVIDEFPLTSRLFVMSTDLLTVRP